LGRIIQYLNYLFLVFTITTSLNAQGISTAIALDTTFQFLHADPEFYLTSGSTKAFTGMIYNLNSDSLRLAVVRTINDLPADWSSSICIDSLCLLETVDSTTAFMMGFQDSVKCELLINAQSLGNGHIQLYLFNLQDENDHIIVDINIYSTSNINIANDPPFPAQPQLYQNFPNPFNPVTTLRYEIPETGLVNITIYNMLGREVKTLINQTQDAGYRSVIWNATNDYGIPVSAGIYLYQIQAGEYISTKKMVLLK